MRIQKDDVLAALADSEQSGLTMSQLAAALEAGKKDRDKLRTLVGRLVDDGVVEKVGRRYALGERVAAPAPGGPHAAGLIRVHPAGYGFVERDDGLGDVFVPAKYRGNAMDGDRVMLYTWDGYKGTEGRVEEVLSRGRARLTGVLQKAGRSVYLEPDDPRIAADFGRVTLIKGTAQSAVGKAVIVEIVEYPTAARDRIVGKVTRILGDPEDPNTEIEKIIACADIPAEFPDAVVGQAERASTEVLEADLADRIDLRDRPFLTIDPETARDFDDALCLEEDGPHGGPRVWVAVADVSHYVRPGTAIDEEAVIRGVSVYLPDRVIPMLPFQLSSGICSLNPEVDRCAMVVRLDYDEDDELANTGFAAAVIRSHGRLDYPGVAAALAGDLRGSRSRYRRWVPKLEGLNRLAKKLRQDRRERGTLELEISEAKVVLDADDPRLVRDVVRAKANPAERDAYELVEEFMIAANEAVGDYFARRNLPTAWRVHAPPDAERLEDLASTLEKFGITFDVDAAQSPNGLQALLAKLEGLPAERALSFQVLRSLKQAVYDTENIGHFGLASDRYLHFTSPIRRYPDLIVHRLLKHYLHRDGQAAGIDGKRAQPPNRTEIGELCQLASSHERRAVEAEREAVSLYRAYLMRDQIGEEFEGTVSGVTSFGVFVEIDDPFVEGLVKLDALGDDRFDFNAESMQIAGRHTGVIIGLGDRVAVEVTDASVLQRRITLKLLSVLERFGSAKKKQKAGKPRSPKSQSPKSGKSKKGGRSKARGQARDDASGGRGRGKGKKAKKGKKRR
ncbi:MAG: ribonuclease R [Deltaproteobacteria bacterium]|nr:ribonuclease R [Deltaproteobacteria bacterium]